MTFLQLERGCCIQQVIQPGTSKSFPQDRMNCFLELSGSAIHGGECQAILLLTYCLSAVLERISLTSTSAGSPSVGLQLLNCNGRVFASVLYFQLLQSLLLFLQLLHIPWSPTPPLHTEDCCWFSLQWCLSRNQYLPRGSLQWANRERAWCFTTQHTDRSSSPTANQAKKNMCCQR